VPAAKSILITLRASPNRGRVRVGTQTQAGHEGSLIKGRRTGWPRVENDTAIMAVGIYHPVDDALRIAFTELVAWIKSDYGLSALDAYELFSKVAKSAWPKWLTRTTPWVSIHKRFLPPRRKSE
jgi:hypothetical protein